MASSSASLGGGPGFGAGGSQVVSPLKPVIGGEVGGAIWAAFLAAGAAEHLSTGSEDRRPPGQLPLP